MNHLENINAWVDEVLKRGVIREMNELLCALSEDNKLSREDRRVLQQQLRLAVFQQVTEKRRMAERRRQSLTQGGIII